MKKIRVGVIGTGYLGGFHAEKYAGIADAELVGVADPDEARAGQIAEKLNARAYSDYEKLFGQVDAVSIAAPTVHHYKIAALCLQRGIHTLIEKPITVTLEQADELIELAEEKGLVLQVGHIERFNPAVTAVKALLASPRYMTAERSAPFTVRCTDVNVVLDLMIHDLDISLDMAGAEPLEVSAAGASVITKEIDAATARITFGNGCVADIAASRVSEEKNRTLRIFDGDRVYLSDYQTQKAVVFRRGGNSTPELIPSDISTERCDTLAEEIRSFVLCVQNRKKPVVGGREGRTALALARLITKNIENGVKGFTPVG